MIAMLLIFMIVIMIFRQSLNEIGKDPNLNFLNLNATFETALIINLNKNNYPDRIDECWNQMNPFVECSEQNTLTEGDYVLRGVDKKWLDKADNFEIEFNNRTYYQKIHITYPNENHIKFEAETWNDNGEKEYQDITLTKQ